MAFIAGICPKCGEYILLKDNIPFLVCPVCSGTVSNNEAANVLNKKCNDKDNVSEVIADCIALEVRYGQELPFMVLATLCDNFPRMEQPAYLLTKLSGYDFPAVRMYLEKFSGIKSEPHNVPWAEEFLNSCISYQNMEFADRFMAYAENKLAPDKKQKYIDKIEALRKQYTAKAADPKSTRLLLMLYIMSAIANVVLLPLFIFTEMIFVINIVIAMTLISAEIGLLFWHNKAFGNRLGMTERERLYMVIFMCSLFFALGAGVIGSIYKIQL
jgi:hypothetical protein